MKEKEFSDFCRSIYLLASLLGKKCTILSELTLMSLSMKNNIFKLPLFDDFCSSYEYAEVINMIDSD